MPDMGKELTALGGMTAGELARRYAELFGEPTRSWNRAYLVRKIAWKLQALAEGDLSERGRRRAEDLAQGTLLRVMPAKARPSAQAGEVVTTSPPGGDPRLPPPGTAIVRHYKGRVLQVLVLTDGFEFEGRRYPSLSAVAKAITGSHLRGYRFFRLGAWGVGGKRLRTKRADQTGQRASTAFVPLAQPRCLILRQELKAMSQIDEIAQLAERAEGPVEELDAFLDALPSTALDDVGCHGDGCPPHLRSQAEKLRPGKPCLLYTSPSPRDS